VRKKERSDVLITRIHKLADDLKEIADKHLDQLLINDVDRPTDEDAIKETFRKITANPEIARLLLGPGENKRAWRRWTRYALEAAWPIYPELLVQALRDTLKRCWAVDMIHNRPVRNKGQAKENAEYARAESVACERIAKMFSEAAKRLEKLRVEYETWQDEP
jgi:hypothetical protein